MLKKKKGSGNIDSTAICKMSGRDAVEGGAAGRFKYYREKCRCAVL